jgi:CDP-diacylglycerol---glycerol-3-phosphate 3-phosphatidyltransferase
MVESKMGGSYRCPTRALTGPISSRSMFDGRFRVPVERAVRPLGQALRRTGLSPDHLTVVGLLVAVAAAVCIAQGRLVGGLFLVILAALPDLLDGALAKASGASSQRGAYFDSVIDRVTDALLFGGLAWYLASEESPHMALLPFAIMAVSSIISYQRAKAESLGLNAKGGLMERAERIILLCLGLLFSSLLIPILWVMLALTGVTAIQRFIKVWKQAAIAPVTAAKIEMRRHRRSSRRVARADRMAQVRVRRRPPPP